MSAESNFRPFARSNTPPSVVPAPAGLTRNELFDHIARAHDGFAFTAEDGPKLAALRTRLGDVCGQHVVEPGCGSGHLTAHLAEWVGPGGQVVAFDPSAGMVDRTRARTAALAHVTTHQSTLEAFTLAGGACDVVVCFRVWPHFDDDDVALAVVARWLKPGGRLLIVHWDGREKLNAIHASHQAVAEDVFPVRARLEEAFVRHGFELHHWVEDSEEIFIEVTRCDSGSLV